MVLDSNDLSVRLIKDKLEISFGSNLVKPLWVWYAINYSLVLAISSMFQVEYYMISISGKR